MKKLFLLSLVLLVTACQKHKPVESLTYEEKEAITKECQANGKIQTDDYCKQVSFVYQGEHLKRTFDERRKKNARSSVTKMPY